jgi:hypothetical protein
MEERILGKDKIGVRFPLLAPFKKEEVMKKLLMCLMVIFLLFSFAPVIQHAHAVSVNVNLEDLPEEARNAILDHQAGKDKQISPDQVVQFEKYGLALGKSINALVKELGITLNDFIKTPVGKLTTAVLLWKLVLFEVLLVCLKLGSLIFATSILLFSFMRFHVPSKQKKKDKESDEIKINWIQKYEFSSGDAKMFSVLAHIALAIALMIAFFALI